MSSSAAVARAATRPAVRPSPGSRHRPGPPRLRVVAPAPAGSRVGLALLCVALLCTGLLALLLLNISISRGSYELTDYQREQLRLAEQEQVLQEAVEAAGAPQQLAAKARALGMVPQPNPAFVRVPDGRVLGRPAEAKAPPRSDSDTPATSAKKLAEQAAGTSEQTPTTTKKAADQTRRP